MNPLTGGCQCGAIRFSIKSEPLLAYCCHCTDCQKQTSSAFGMSVWVHARDFTLLRGELALWHTEAESGAQKTCIFCAECGTRLYHGAMGTSDIISVKGGALDAIAQITPVAHIWTQSALPWVLALLDKDMCHLREPDCMDELLARFQGADPVAL